MQLLLTDSFGGPSHRLVRWFSPPIVAAIQGDRRLDHGWLLSCLGMRILSWNVNSLRSRVDLVGRVIDRLEPDVMLLQETKCRDDQLDELRLELFTGRGYQIAHHGRDHWNGVAVASRVGLRSVEVGFGGVQQPPFDEARLITAVVGTGSSPVRVVSIYVPNGRALDDPHYLYKLVWLERLRGDATARGWIDGPTVLAGDFNVAPTDSDIYDPRRWRGKKHASPPERAAIVALGDLGFVDAARTLHPDTPEFTWWNYRQTLADDRGLRIDLSLISPPLWPRVEACWVDREARAADRPSDHAPLITDLID